MSDRPILFSAPMVRALLDGRKTQTRRLLKPQIHRQITDCYFSETGWAYQTDDGRGCTCIAAKGPTYAPGDRLWVKEAFRQTRETLVYQLDDANVPGGGFAWQSWMYAYGRDKEIHQRHMRRRSSRLTLIVTDVRVQRLQDISEADAIAEGVERDSDGWRDYEMPQTQCCFNPKCSFLTLWNSINGPGAWDTNPWVTAISFDVHRGNITNAPQGGGE